MFNIKYFISYEIPKSETTSIKGWDVIKAPLFADLDLFIDDYAFAVAAVNKTEFENVIITQFNKIN